ncbi:IS630 transposase-related protein [Streptococcus pneumoniae]
MAYSIDFRKKVLSYCEQTGSVTEAYKLPSFLTWARSSGG